MDVIGIYKDAWSLYKKNLSRFVIAIIMTLVLAFVPVLLFGGIGAGLIFVGITSFAADAMVMWALFGLAILFFLFGIVLASAIQGGFTGFCYDIVQGKKADWHAVVDWTKKLWVKFGLLSLLILVLSVLIMAPGIIGGVYINPFVSTAWNILLLPVFFAIEILSGLAVVRIVVGYEGPVESFVGAIKTALDNLVPFLVFLLVYGVLVLPSLIPVLGVIFAILLLSPVVSTAYVLFYLATKKPVSRKPAPKKAVKKKARKKK